MVNPEILERLQRARTKKEKPALKPIQRVSEKKMKELADAKALKKLDKEFYLEVWNASPHRCLECGKKLGPKPLTIFMHHLLAKAKYPQFRHTPENITIVCADCHSQAETDIDKVPKIKRRRDEVAKILLNQ